MELDVIMVEVNVVDEELVLVVNMVDGDVFILVDFGLLVGFEGLILI